MWAENLDKPCAESYHIEVSYLIIRPALTLDGPISVTGNVFFAVEIEQRHVVVSSCGASIDVLVDSCVVRLQGDDKLGHLTVALESSEAAFGFQGACGAPA